MAVEFPRNVPKAEYAKAMIMKIDFVFDNIHIRAAKGIYRLSIGGKFYIGQAENLFARIYHHTLSLNNELHRYPILKQTQYSEWCRYILENPSINTVQVQLLQRCIGNSHLYFAEQYYLTEYKDHPDCLNISWSSRRPPCFFGEEDKFWDVEYLDDGCAYYTDPINGGEIIFSDAELTSRGKPRKRRILVH